MLEEFVNEHASNLEHVYEYLKLKKKMGGASNFENIATKALDLDLGRQSKILLAEKVLKLLTREESLGSIFKAKAKEYFKYTPYFNE